MNVSGTEMQNQSARTATKVPNGMAAEEPSPQRIRFMIKKSANTMLKRDTGALNNSTQFQCYLLSILLLTFTIRHHTEKIR